MKQVIKLILTGLISFILFMSIFVIAERALYSEQRNGNITEPSFRDYKDKPYKAMSFIEAIRAGDIDKVKQYVRNGSPINSKSKLGRTPLIEAVREDQFEVAKFLVEQNAFIDTIGRNELPLTTAVKNNNMDIVKLLVENGADINKVLIRNRTALYYSAMLGYVEITKYLFSNGADIYLTKKGQYTRSVISEVIYLNSAILSSSRDVLGNRILTKYINRDLYRGEPKLEAELRNIQNKRKILNFLVDNCTDERVIETYGKIIKPAYENGNTVLARKMLKKIPTNSKEAYEEILKYAASAGDFQTVKELVEAGTTISDFTKKGMSGSIRQGSIYYAAVNGNLEILKYLLKNREFNFQESELKSEFDTDPELTPALKMVIKNKYSDTAIFLMNKGASLRELPGDGGCMSGLPISPMQLAVEYNLSKVVTYLIDKGIKPDKKCLQIAIKRKHHKIEKIIREQFDIPQVADVVWAKTIVSKGQINKISRLDSLLNSWMKIDISDGCLLRIACENNHYEFVEYLLKKGANPNLRPDITQFEKYSFPQDECHSRENPTALMYACENPNSKMIRLLLKYEAEVNALDTHNNNALFYLLNNRTSDIAFLKEMFLLLYDNGIKTTMALKNLKIFHKANQTKEFIEFIDLLIEKGADMNYSGPISQGRSHNHLIVKLVIHSQPEVIEHVIKKGIDLSYRDEYGKNLLMLENFKLVNNESYVSLLKSGINLHEEDNEGNSLLHYVMRYVNIDILRELQNFNLDWDHKNKKGETPIMMLYNYRDNYTEIFEILVQQKVDMNAKDNYGKSVLYHLISRPKILDLLLENGAKIDERDKYGHTPFLRCIYNGSMKSAEVFLAKGTDINERNTNNESAILILINRLKNKQSMYNKRVIRQIKSLFQYAEETNQQILDINKAEEILKTKGYDSFEELLNPKEQSQRSFKT